MGCSPCCGKKQNVTVPVKPVQHNSGDPNQYAINRITDVEINQKYQTATVNSLWKTPALTLEQALQYLMSRIENLNLHVQEAKHNCHFPSERGLTLDESAAVYLYTMNTENRSFYDQLNRALKSGDSNQIDIWLPYFKILKSALDKLPTHKKVLWRALNLSKKTDIEQCSELIWHGIASCAQSPNDIREYRQRNLLLIKIDNANGKDITGYSASRVKEVLLWPISKLKIKSKPTLTNDGTYIMDLVGVTEIDNLKTQRPISPRHVNEISLLKHFKCPVIPCFYSLIFLFRYHFK